MMTYGPPVQLRTTTDKRVARSGSPTRTPASAALPAAPRCACGGTCPRCAGQGRRASVKTDGLEQEARRLAPALAGSAAMDELVRDAGMNAPHRFSDASRAQIRKDFGRDLTGVNLRTDVAGATRARSLGAHAVTLGQDIHFAQGRLERHTEPGRTLIAHELVHALQAAPVAAGGGPLRVAGHASGGVPLRDGATSETVLLQGDPLPADAEVDDIVVWFYINTALKNNGDSVWGAFGDLQDARHAPGWEQDPNLAAAEHYMFARFLSQSGMPNFFVASMAIDYGLAKELLKEYGIDPSFSDKPTSKSSTKQIDYGIRGAFEGGWIQKAIDWVFD